MSQIHAERDQTNVVLPLAVTDGGGVPGLTAVVALRDGPSSTSYLDWNDMTFKAAAWTTREAPMTDLGAGFYTRVLNISAITNLPAATRQLVAEYRVSGVIEGVAEDHILLANEVFDAASAPAVALVQADTDDIQARLPATLVGGRMRAHVEAVDATPAGTIADAVWDEATAGHQAAGSTGLALTAASVAEKQVRSSFAYNVSTATLVGNVWLEQEGQHISSVTSCSLSFYNADGALLFTTTDITPDAQGIFKVSQASPTGFTAGAQVYVLCDLVAPSGTYRTVKGIQVIG